MSSTPLASVAAMTRVTLAARVMTDRFRVGMETLVKAIVEWSHEIAKYFRRPTPDPPIPLHGFTPNYDLVCAVWPLRPRGMSRRTSMSRTKPADHERAELQFPCSYCTAPRGVWCVAQSGAAARWPHQARWQAVREIVRLSGWEQWLEETGADLLAVRQAVRAILSAARQPDCASGVSTPWLVNQLVAALQAHGQAA